MYHVDDGKHKSKKTLLLPVSVSRGITLKQKQAEDKALELMHYKYSKLRRKTPFKMKTFNNYFENLDRINSNR